MAIANIIRGLELSEEEAYALLSLCLTSPEPLDAVSQKALHKLASFCTGRDRIHSADRTCTDQIRTSH